MNSTTKKIIIWISSIIGIGIIAYLVFVGTVLYTFKVGCGFDDGPFEAKIISNQRLSEFSTIFKLEKGELIIDNRNDSLSPLIILKEKGLVKWTLDIDTRNTEGYESTRIWEITDVKIIKGTDPIKLEFLGHWTYGAEFGSIKIDRNDADNSFCLSW